MDEFQVVPEEIVLYCSRQFAPDEENSFKDLLKLAHEFRMAGLTPVYLTTDTLKDMFITTKENIEKKYH